MRSLGAWNSHAGLPVFHFSNRFIAARQRGAADTLVKFHVEEKGRKVRYAQGFEVCDYGRQPSQDELKRQFPF